MRGLPGAERPPGHHRAPDGPGEVVEPAADGEMGGQLAGLTVQAEVGPEGRPDKAHMADRRRGRVRAGCKHAPKAAGCVGLEPGPGMQAMTLGSEVSGYAA